MLAQNIAFGILAVTMVLAGIRVVTSQNVVHAALYLVVVLAGVAGIFILLAAEFTAATQVLVYIGAIVVLLLFGVMLTRAPIGPTADLDNPQSAKYGGVLVTALLLFMIAFVQADAFGKVRLDPARVQRTSEVGDSIFSTFVLPFEVISVLLLAALVGAVVIARRD